MARAKFQTLTEQMFYTLLCLKEECYGLDILDRIPAMTDGRVSVGSGTLYNLLEQFLDAGFPQETAVRMINSCMLLQNRQQMFSTIDLCMIDLYNATCDMIKSGAAATFICQGNEIEVIQSNAFPAGVMQQSGYECMHRKLTSGSTVLANYTPQVVIVYPFVYGTG